jgi:hypothetical protein
MTDQACGCEAATGDDTYKCDVKCKEPAFVVQIVPVDVASAKKLYRD